MGGACCKLSPVPTGSLRKATRSECSALSTEVLAALPEGVLVVEHSGAIVWANAAASALIGVPVRDMMGTQLLSWIEDSSVGAVKAAVANMWATDSKTSSPSASRLVVAVRARLGALRSVFLSFGVAHLARDGQESGARGRVLIATLVDSTALPHDTRAGAVAAAAAREEVLAFVTHEVRNALAPVQIGVEGLLAGIEEDAENGASDGRPAPAHGEPRGGAGDPQNRRGGGGGNGDLSPGSDDVDRGRVQADVGTLRLLKQATTSAMAILNGILDIERLRQGHGLAKSWFPLADMVEQAWRVARVQGSARGVAVELDVAEALGKVEIDGAEGKLGQCLANFVSNSLKLTPSGGCVTLYASLEERTPADALEPFLPQAAPTTPVVPSRGRRRASARTGRGVPAPPRLPRAGTIAPPPVTVVAPAANSVPIVGARGSVLTGATSPHHTGTSSDPSPTVTDTAASAPAPAPAVHVSAADTNSASGGGFAGGSTAVPFGFGASPASAGSVYGSDHGASLASGSGGPTQLSAASVATGTELPAIASSSQDILPPLPGSLRSAASPAGPPSFAVLGEARADAGDSRFGKLPALHRRGGGGSEAHGGDAGDSGSVGYRRRRQSIAGPREEVSASNAWHTFPARPGDATERWGGDGRKLPACGGGGGGRNGLIAGGRVGNSRRGRGRGNGDRIGGDGSGSDGNGSDGGGGGAYARLSRGWIRIGVRDTGEGLSPRDRGRLFRPFEQLANEKTRKGVGTGLGLAFVREVAERGHGGRVGVATPGRKRGADFFLLLPATCGRATDVWGVSAVLSSSQSTPDNQGGGSNGGSGEAGAVASPPAPAHPPGQHCGAGALEGPRSLAQSAAATRPRERDGPAGGPVGPASGRSARTQHGVGVAAPQSGPTADSGASTGSSPPAAPRGPGETPEPALVPAVGGPSLASWASGGLLASSGSGSTAFEGARVLIVDDSAIMRRLMSRTLQRRGLDVSTASSGEEALAALSGAEAEAAEAARAEGAKGGAGAANAGRGQFDCVITDWHMPGAEVEGKELARRVREAYPHVVVLLVSGSDATAYKHAHACLTKPVGASTLYGTIRRSVARMRRQQRVMHIAEGTARSDGSRQEDGAGGEGGPGATPDGEEGKDGPRAGSAPSPGQN